MSAIHTAVVLCLAAAASASGEEPQISTPPVDTRGGTATMPLEALLPLLEQRAPARADTPPPVGAVVTRAELKGRLAADAMHLDAHFEVRVLAEDRWTRVPLLGVSPETFLAADPQVDKAVVAIHQGELLLLSNQPGAYSVDVSLTVRAAQSGARRSASLRVAPGAPPAQLQLEVDPAFTVVEPASASGEPSVSIFPRGSEWSVAWTVAEQKTSPRVAAAQRPALEPKIARARAVWVSTLEGKLGLRVAYALRLNRPEKISVEAPAGYKLERAAVNGRPVPLPEAGKALELEVAPPNVGDSEARLELALSQELGVFHLSGDLRLSMPRASWPIAEVAGEAYLPTVFNYRRHGGSLEQLPDGAAGASSKDAAFNSLAQDGDTLPGKVLHFRQHLVSSSAPTVELGYSVDIAKSYFQ